MAGMIDPSFKMPKPANTGVTGGAGPIAARGGVTPTPRRDTPIYGPGGIERFEAPSNDRYAPYIPPAPVSHSTVTRNTGMDAFLPPSVQGLDNAANPYAQQANPLDNDTGHFLRSSGGGPTGVRQDSYEDQEMERLRRAGDIAELERRAQLNREEFDRRLSVLDPRTSMPGGGGSGFDPNASKAASDAIFARAKDRSGQIARASTDTIRNVLGERGVLGGGYEADAYEGIVSAAQGELGEVNRDIMIDDLDRLYEVEDRNLNDATIRRGQDLGVRNSLLGLMNTSLY